jgi:phage terminase large subunit-like protein
LKKKFLDELSDGELMALPYLFEFWALEHQIPLLNYWKTWIVLGGRGAGKTRAGAEWARSFWLKCQACP